VSLVAFISDIHANLDALEAVLADIEEQRADTIICLGDVVGYGPEPAQCLRLIRQKCWAIVMGNHEAMMIQMDVKALGHMHPIVGKPLLLAHEQLTPAEISAVGALPLVTEYDPVVGVHASLVDPGRFAYVHAEGDAQEHFTFQSWHICFHGHTHVPVIWEQWGSRVFCYAQTERAVRFFPGHKYAVNVGSVGQPRDGNPLACYALYDTEEHLLRHRRVVYDIKKAQGRFRKARLPDDSRLRIEVGF